MAAHCVHWQEEEEEEEDHQLKDGSSQSGNSIYRACEE